MVRIVGALLAFVVAAGCGGGGSSSTPANPDAVTVRVNNVTPHMRITQLDLWYSDTGQYWGRTTTPGTIQIGAFLQWIAQMIGPDSTFDVQALGSNVNTGSPALSEVLLDVPIARGGYVELTFNGTP